MACFWTDLVGTTQECDGDSAAVVASISIDNGFFTDIEWHLAEETVEAPAAFVPESDFYMDFGPPTGTCTATWEAENSRYASELNFMSGDYLDGILYQGSNSWPCRAIFGLS